MTDGGKWVVIQCDRCNGFGVDPDALPKERTLSMTDGRYWTQPDLDQPGAWTVCMDEKNPKMVRGGLSEEDAEKLLARLNRTHGEKSKNMEG